MATDHLDRLEHTSSALRALGSMVVTLLESGDDHHHIAAGVSELFEGECRDLDDIRTDLREQVMGGSVAALDIKDPAFVAKLTGVPIRTVNMVIWAACGINVERHTDTMLADDDALYEAFRRKLREADLVERARGTVSEWSGVPAETVEKVLHAAGEAATEFMYRTHKNERSPESLKLEAEMLARHEQYKASKAAGGITSTVDETTAERIMREDAEQAALDHQSEKLDAELAGFDPQLSPQELREKFIADSMRRGVEVADIAQALNMKRAAVEKLVGQLIGEVRPHREPPQDKAANG